MPPLRILLVQGMRPTPLLLMGLAYDLRRAGHHPEIVSYLAAAERFETIRARVRRALERLHRFWLYRLVNGESGQRLADPTFFEALPPLPVPCTVVAGTRGPRASWSPFRHAPNDGVVSVSEVVPTDATLVELPVTHTFMLTHRHVRTLVRDLLNR